MKLKYTWIPFIFAFLFFVPLRLYVVITESYPSIGSFSYSYLEMMSNILAALFVLMIIIMCLITKNAPSNMDFKKNIFAGVLAVLSGIMLICSGVLAAIDVYDEFDSKTLALSILSIISGIIFFLMAFTHFTSKNLFKKAPLLILFPVFWCGLRIFMLFIDYTAIVSTHINASYMLALMFLFVFLFMQSRAFVHVDFKSIVKKMIIFGMPSIILLGSYASSDIITLTSSNKFAFDYTSMLIVTDAVLAFYVLSILLEVTMLKNDDENEHYKSMYSSLDTKNSENNPSYEIDEESKSRIVPDSMTRESKKESTDNQQVNSEDKLTSDEIDDLINGL